MIGLINENSFSCNGLTLAYSRLTPNLPDFGLTEKYWDEWDRASSDDAQASVPLLELQRSIEMPLTQVWLALLLNGFEIE
jgi:hypothetical protein